MSHPELFALLRGELTNAEATAAGVHLDGCSHCQTELAELAVGNALLSHAARTLRTSAGATDTMTAVPPLRRRSPRRAPALLVAAAAVAVGLVGGAAATALLGGSTDDSPTPEPYASVSLDAVEGSAGGEVRMVSEGARRTRMTIEATDLPGAGPGHFYYAWLLDPESNKMLPLGQVGPDGTASFELDDALLDAYDAVDVSLEDDDGDPGHSITSVLRGAYDEDPPSRRS
jgi:hypothetical protein